jgi:hypothetical protein
MGYDINDTSWETLFWSLMDAIEDNDDLMDLYEVFEQAALQVDSDENGN